MLRASCCLQQTSSLRILRRHVDAAPPHLSPSSVALSIDLPTPALDACSFSLQKCAAARALTAGHHVHNVIVELDIESHPRIQNLLLKMYVNCGALLEAHMVFQKMSAPDTSTYECVLVAYLRHKQTMNALLVLHDMEQKGMAANKFLMVMLLSVYAEEENAASGARFVHHCIQSIGCEKDVVVATALVDIYGKCGKLEEAQVVFDKMPARNIISWTALITSHVKQDKLGNAFQLFRRMESESMSANQFTFVSMLSSLSEANELTEGKRIHARVVGVGCKCDIFLGTSLLAMYGKCGSLVDARTVFNNMPNRNFVSWTAMVTACCEQGNSDEAFTLHERMQREGIAPNKFTFVSILHLCTNLLDVVRGKQVHAEVLFSGCELDLVVGNAILELYGKCGAVCDALCIFQGMLHHDVVSWTSIISALAMNGKSGEAIQSYMQMRLEGVLPNSITFIILLSACNDLTAFVWGKLVHTHIVCCELEIDVMLGTALVNMYSSCGDPANAKKIFNELPERDIVTWNTIMAQCDDWQDVQKVFDSMPQHDEVSWNTLMNVYIQYGYYDISLCLFQEMQMQCLIPTKYTIVHILEACAFLPLLILGKRMHVRITSNGFEKDTMVGNALIHMYSKCGCLDDACITFDEMESRDVVSWSTMILGYAQYGQGDEAILLFQHMQVQNKLPNEVTLVNILSACSHSGLPSESTGILINMLDTCTVLSTVDHYNCILDTLGRTGRLMDCKALLCYLPFQLSVTLWMTLLGACRMHNDKACAEQSANHILELDPENATACVMSYNVKQFSEGPS